MNGLIKLSKFKLLTALVLLDLLKILIWSNKIMRDIDDVIHSLVF